MALAQIDESEPWLEDDEENIEKNKELYEKLQKKLAEKPLVKRKSLTGTVTTIAMVSVYTYLTIQLISKYRFARVVYTFLKQFFLKSDSVSSIAAVLLITLLSRLRL